MKRLCHNIFFEHRNISKRDLEQRMKDIFYTDHPKEMKKIDKEIGWSKFYNGKVESEVIYLVILLDL